MVMAGLFVAGFFLAQSVRIETLRSWLEPLSAVGGPFALQDTDGRTVTEMDLAGKPFALFFGFTHCPEVCPATLERVSRWIAALGKDADGMRFLFATVDPARDTGAVLKDYLANFDPRILGLTGSEAEVARLVSAYRVFVRRVETGGSAYTIDHTSAVYLMDRASHFATVIGYDESDEKAIAKLRALIAQAAPR